ncbi:hypothetical protein EI555_004323, partial [Monodon monoceros]
TRWTGRGASRVPQRPAGLSRNPGAGPDRCAEARQGGGEGRVLGSGKQRGGGDQGRTSAASPGQLSAPGTAGGGALAHTRGHKDSRAHAPPCGSRRRLCPDCTHTHTPPAYSPASRAHRTLRAVRAGPRPPEAHTLVCTHSHTHIPRPRGHRAAPTAQTPHPRHSLPRPPRVFTPTPRSVTGGGWMLGRGTPRGAHERGAPEPGRRPSPPRTPSPRQRARPLRPTLTVCPAAAAAAARAPARPRRCLPAGPRRRRQRQGRSGRPPVLGPPPAARSPPPPAF